MQGELTGKQALAYTLERYLQYQRVLLQDLPPSFRQAQIEGVVVDEAFQGAATAAEAQGLPWVTVSNALAFVPDPALPPPVTHLTYDPTPAGCARNLQAYAAMNQLFVPLVEMINHYREMWHLHPLSSHSAGASPLAHVTQQPACFDFPRTSRPRNFHYAGPF